MFSHTYIRAILTFVLEIYILLENNTIEQIIKSKQNTEIWTE